jgi:hypothetical protein
VAKGCVHGSSRRSVTGALAVDLREWTMADDRGPLPAALAVRWWPGAALPRSHPSPAVAGWGKGGPKAHPGGTRSALAAAKTGGIICGRGRAAHRRAADLCALASAVRGGSPMFAGLASPMAPKDVRRGTRSSVTPGISVDDALAEGGGGDRCGSVMRRFWYGLTCTDAAEKAMGFLWAITLGPGFETG